MSFADLELLRQGVRLEPLLRARFQGILHAAAATS
jgi:hypothetical protein